MQLEKESPSKIAVNPISVDIAAIAKMYGKEYERDGIRYMAVERLLADFKLKTSRFKVRDTVNHGSVIGESHI